MNCLLAAVSQSGRRRGILSDPSPPLIHHDAADADTAVAAAIATADADAAAGHVTL